MMRDLEYLARILQKVVDTARTSGRERRMFLGPRESRILF